MSASEIMMRIDVGVKRKKKEKRDCTEITCTRVTLASNRLILFFFLSFVRVVLRCYVWLNWVINKWERLTFQRKKVCMAAIKKLSV